MSEHEQRQDAEFAEAFETHGDLVERLASGDLHALDSLIEATAGVRVVASRTVTPAP